jgi:hypothetical protein
MKKVYSLICALTMSALAFAQTVNVTFIVDARNETIDASGAHIAGSFATNAWTPSARPMTNSGGTIWKVTLALPTNSTLEYKFVKGNDWPFGDENLSGQPCAATGNGNRFLQIGTTDITVDTVCWNSCAKCPSAPPSSANITLNVDLNYSCVDNPDSVTVAGINGNWGSGYRMMPVAGQPGIYSVMIPSTVGNAIHKFRTHKNGNTNWEGGGDKPLTIAGDTILPVRCFGVDTYGSCAPIPNPANVTLVVDITNETPQSSGVFVMGNFTEPAWQSGALQMTQSPTNPFIYSITLNNFCPGTAFYKFVIGTPGQSGAQEENYDFSADGCGVDNGTFPDNRIMTRTDANPVAFGYIFNSCTTIATSVEENTVDAYSIYPNPAIQNAQINFNNAVSNYQITITDITGKVIAETASFSGKIYPINTSSLNKGIYLVSVKNAKGILKADKLIIQ